MWERMLVNFEWSTEHTGGCIKSTQLTQRHGDRRLD